MNKIAVDAHRLPLLLQELRLPAIGRLWPDLAAQADKEGWPAARFLAALAEFEVAERARRRIHPARRSTASSSMPSRCSAKHRSWRWPPATAG
jgi:DNA replication protein DnaC